MQKNYSNIPHIRNSIFHLRPKNVSYNTRLSGNEGQCFLYKGCKLIAFHMFDYTRQIKCDKTTKIYMWDVTVILYNQYKRTHQTCNRQMNAYLAPLFTTREISLVISPYCNMSGWPSGLRRCVQVAVYSCRRGFESHF